MKIKIVKNYDGFKNVVATSLNKTLNSIQGITEEKVVKHCKSVINMNWSNTVYYTKLYINNVFIGGAIDKDTFFTKRRMI